jgi:hypothetical protein
VRRERARKNARPARPWAQVAGEFLACVARM